MSSVHRFAFCPSTKWLFGLSFVLLAAGTLASCSAPQDQTTVASPAPTPTSLVDAKAPSTTGIKVDGSSTVYPITDAVAREFRQNAGQGVEIEVQFSGSSAGFRRFCNVETDISNASRPILVEEIEACDQAGVRFIELPVAFDALTVVVNPQNTWADTMTMAELKTIWAPAAEGKVKTWNQVRSGFPNQPLVLFGPGADSGTFDYFNEVVLGDNQSRDDYTGSEDDTVIVKGVQDNVNALAYLPFSYYEENQTSLKALAIDSGSGPVRPSRETVENATYQPFSRPLFIYVNAKSAQTKPEVRNFVEFYLKNAKTVVPQVGYVPLPDEGYRLATVQFERGEVGTVFEGVPQPNVTIAELLRRQAVFRLTQQ